jgi:TldD protein
VHFGVRFERDPIAVSTELHLEELKALLARSKEMAVSVGIAAEDLTYSMVRRTVGVEESLSIDREANLSQTLYRVALTSVTMSGSDRTYTRLGGLGGLEVSEFSEEELKRQLEDLREVKRAERLQPGQYRVIFGPELSGVLAHEAFGHAQEGDTCARGRSKAWELHHSGERVGNQHATILNNPAIFENGTQSGAAWGSYFFDEEGWLAQEQLLLDRGVLKAPMTNLTSALRLGVPRTANGKRESWASGVYTRQTNTYFSAGEDTLDSLLLKLGDGFVGMAPAGGMEDPKGMGIQVGISFLKEVRGGKFTGRIFRGPAGGDIQLTGYVPDVLDSIVAKSKIEFDRSEADRVRHPLNDAGGCGKYHKEFVNAGCGGPYMLLEGVTLG